jgi:hypothetical protein
MGRSSIPPCNRAVRRANSVQIVSNGCNAVLTGTLYFADYRRGPLWRRQRALSARSLPSRREGGSVSLCGLLTAETSDLSVADDIVQPPQGIGATPGARRHIRRRGAHGSGRWDGGGRQWTPVELSPAGAALKGCAAGHARQLVHQVGRRHGDGIVAHAVRTAIRRRRRHFNHANAPIVYIVPRPHFRKQSSQYQMGSGVAQRGAPHHNQGQCTVGTAISFESLDFRAASGDL